MYRIALIEHDIDALQIMTQLCLEDARFDVVLATAFPKSAAAQLLDARPDAVILDAQLPSEDAFRVIRHLRDNDARMEIILTSTAEDFNCAVQAIRVGVFDFCIKPLVPANFSEMLKRLCVQLEDRRIITDFELYSRLQDRTESSSALLRRFFPKPLFACIQASELEIEENSTRWDYSAEEPNAQYLVLRLGPTRCVTIINSAEDITERLCERIQKQSDALRVSFSRVTDFSTPMRQLLFEAEIALKDAFIYPKKRILYYRPMDFGSNISREKEILKLFESNNFTGLDQMALGAARKIASKGLGVRDVLHVWNRIAQQTSSALGDNALDVMDLNELTERFEDLEDMCRFLSVHLWHDRIKEAGTASEYFFEMLRFIEEHYAEDLKLKELCDRFYINQSYCCILFKKHKGQTFSQYLSDVRLGHAKDLLANTFLPLSSICEQVGYGDYFYFNKLFKRKTGFTPLEYRKANMNR